jgi:hypothetical protein
MITNNDEQFSAEETEQRLQKTLRAAFSGPPTPLKDIPTRYGESRKMRRVKTSGASSATAKTASRRKKDRA